MIRLFANQIMTLGSLSIMAATLTLPFQMLGSHQGTLIGNSPQQTMTEKVTLPEPDPGATRPVGVEAGTSSITLIGADTPRSLASLRVDNPEGTGLSDYLFPDMQTIALDDRYTPTQGVAVDDRGLQQAVEAVAAMLPVPPCIEPVVTMPDSVPPDGGVEDMSVRRSSYALAVLPALADDATNARHSSDDTTVAGIVAEAAEEIELAVPPEKEPVVGMANRVVVPSIGIDIAVKPGAYDATTGDWTVDDTAAFHATTTVPINDTNGTTLIYGHAKWGVFGNLPDVAPGSEAVVHAADGQRFVYTFESARQVDPADISMLTVDGPPKLVLQTCSGLFDQHRTIAFFEFKEIIQE